MSAPTRITHLDYLRGLAALAVMFFHYEKWGVETWDANTFLGKCGVYAVSVFFVLSGLTLTLVYEKSGCAQPATWVAFWVKRLFRIFPLLWLTTAATIILDEAPYPIHRILLNFSGLFGFFGPAGDIALGAWSIGDELVYYAVFPFLLWIGLNQRAFFILVWVVTLLTGLLYAFKWIAPDHSITSQWPVYVEPLNHGFFFLSGMAIGLGRVKLLLLPPAFWKRGVALCLLLYIFYTPGSNPIGLVAGVDRIVLSILMIGLTASWYGAKPMLPRRPDGALRWLGEISYSVYLLHPLVYRSLKALDVRFLDSAQAWLFPGALIATLIASHFSYRIMEKPAMDWGRRVAGAMKT
ncbi:MAG: acyltransferase [Saprospirales bacterium]|nr:acyltransferase [Saprospirales bacterium]MBK8919995.1 acyltransferase [Saprospirales bacterium]